MVNPDDYKHLDDDVYTWFGNLRCFRLEDGTLCTNPYMCSFVNEFKYQLISKDGLIAKPNDLELCDLCRFNVDAREKPTEYVIDLFNTTHKGCLYHILALHWEGLNYGDYYTELCKAVAGLSDISDDEFEAIKERVKLKVYEKNGGENK